MNEEKEKAKLIVSELIDLFNDQRSYRDISIAIEVTKTLQLLVRQNHVRRDEVLSHPQLITSLAQLFNTDHDLTRLLASLFHDLSTENNGIRFILSNNLLSILLQSLENLTDDVINFVLTTLRNCLIGLTVESAKDIEKHNGCMIFISLLVHRRSDKQMNFLADCLLRSAMFNRNAQIYLQSSKLFLQELVTLLDETNYNKLSFTLIRMLPLLSSNVHTKASLIQYNLVPILERFLNENFNCKIQRSCLITLRNLSDQMIHMEHFDTLIVLLIRILSTNSDRQCQIYIVDILSNLSCENQTNKSLMIQNNLIQILVHILKQSDLSDQIIEAAICTLRHLTGKCTLANEARESIRINDGIPILIKYLHTREYNWLLIKACIGLIRNLAILTNNLKILCEYRCIYKIGQLLFQMKNHNDRHELFLTTLAVFSQHNEPYRKRIHEQMFNSGCVESLVEFASRTDLDRVQHMSKTIIENLRQSQQNEHQEIINELEKARKIAQFL